MYGWDILCGISKGASTQNILPIHWKMWILFTGENLRALRFKSSYAFFTPHLHLHPPPMLTDMYNWCERDNSKGTWQIVIKFGTHIGSDSAASLLTLQGHGWKVKVTT